MIYSTALWWLQVSSSLSRAANDPDADKVQQAGSQSSLCFLWALERIQIKKKLSWWLVPRGLFDKQRESKFRLACESTVKTKQSLHCSGGPGWVAERLHWLLVNNWPADKLIRKSWCQLINYRTVVVGWCCTMLRTITWMELYCNAKLHATLPPYCCCTTDCMWWFMQILWKPQGERTAEGRLARKSLSRRTVLWFTNNTEMPCNSPEGWLGLTSPGPRLLKQNQKQWSWRLWITGAQTSSIQKQKKVQAGCDVVIVVL